MNFIINLPPKTKKNSQQIIYIKGRPLIIQSKLYRDYEKACREYIPKVNTINQKCSVKCLFYMPTKRRCDLTNLLEAIDDILVKYKVLADDNYNIIDNHDGSRVFYDKNKPRTEITINML